MIQLTGAGKRYGPKILFENVDWMVTPNDRVGIVGANGTGKSTLLKILGGMEGLDYGTITSMKGASIGYLPQEASALGRNDPTLFAKSDPAPPASGCRFYCARRTTMPLCEHQCRESD
jgi:ATPase subunit of ABC transporter with duplicated ATPase domains